jgi:hypothetical protein
VSVRPTAVPHSRNPPREVVDRGLELEDKTAFNPNQGTAEKEAAREKIEAFVKDFLDRLIQHEGNSSNLDVFCRVDLSVHVDSNRKVSFFVNEVERGIATCLWVGNGASTAGHVGTDLAWPLACWIGKEKARLNSTPDP